MAKIRSSNLELYRIIVMLFIVAHHYVVNSGIMDIMEKDPISMRSIYYYIFGAWGKVSINCFVLITGYFMCTSQITLRKFLKLFFELWFYKIIITTVFLLCSYNPCGIKSVVTAFLPITNVSDGFASCFILFYLCIPFLNIMLRSLTQRQHFYLLVLLLGIYTGLGTLLPNRLTTNYVTWFCVLYFISSYIRLYKPLCHFRWGIIVGGAILISIGSIVLLLLLGEKFDKRIPFDYFISDSYKLMALVVGVSMFMWFKDLNIPQSKVINRIAESCFGVLLIHANSDIMRYWLWKDVLNVEGQYYTDYFILHSILSVLAIFIICTAIDQIRIRFIESPFFEYIDKKGLIRKLI